MSARGAGLCPGCVLRGQVHAHLVAVTRPQVLTLSVLWRPGRVVQTEGGLCHRRDFASSPVAPLLVASLLGVPPRLFPTRVCPEKTPFLKFVSGSLRHPQVNSPEGPTELRKAVMQTGALSPWNTDPASSPSPERPPSTSCLCDSGSSRDLGQVGSQCVPFRDCLSSLSTVLQARPRCGRCQSPLSEAE